MSISYLEGKRFGKLVVIEKTQEQSQDYKNIYTILIMTSLMVIFPQRRAYAKIHK